MPIAQKSLDPDFQEFWNRYPRRVAKLKAIEAFKKARKHASLEDILAGIERYRRTKPAYADWAHPASWLNGGRWMDEEDDMPANAISEKTARTLAGAREFLKGGNRGAA